MKLDVFPEMNGVRNVRNQRGRLLGVLRPEGFEPTAFPEEWGRDREGVIHVWAWSLYHGEVTFLTGIEEQ